MLNQEERELKIQQATEAYAKFMDVITPNWKSDPNSCDTPLSQMNLIEIYSCSITDSWPLLRIVARM